MHSWILQTAEHDMTGRQTRKPLGIVAARSKTCPQVRCGQELEFPDYLSNTNTQLHRCSDSPRQHKLFDHREEIEKKERSRRAADATQHRKSLLIF